MGAEPESIHRVDSGLAGGPECQLDIERRGPSMGNPVDFILEPLDVLGLLHELLLRDEEGEECLLVVPVEELRVVRVEGGLRVSFRWIVPPQVPAAAAREQALEAERVLRQRVPHVVRVLVRLGTKV